MKAAIAGLGWVTPLGGELDSVFGAMEAGTVAETKPVENPETGRVHECRVVPPKLVEALARNPRLRRSSPISYFAVAAAQAALADAGPDTNPASRTAVVFGVSNGGVIYTRRFFEQIVKQGANVASPALFPETVYNAPASHLAAALGLDGASYTLVGDNSVGLAAIHLGMQLLALDECDRVVVVGCEEVDWIVCEAFRDWRLTSTPLAEGAGAVVLTRDGVLQLESRPGVAFARRSQAADALRAITSGWDADIIVSGANGAFVERVEAAALPVRKWTLVPKRFLGEAPGASALWQVITAAMALRQHLATSALVPVVGFNQQVAAVRLMAERISRL